MICTMRLTTVTFRWLYFIDDTYSKWNNGPQSIDAKETLERRTSLLRLVVFAGREQQRPGFPNLVEIHSQSIFERTQLPLLIPGYVDCTAHIHKSVPCTFKGSYCTKMHRMSPLASCTYMTSSISLPRRGILLTRLLFSLNTKLLFTICWDIQFRAMFSFWCNASISFFIFCTVKNRHTMSS